MGMEQGAMRVEWPPAKDEDVFRDLEAHFGRRFYGQSHQSVAFVTFIPESVTDGLITGAAILHRLQERHQISGALCAGDLRFSLSDLGI